MDMCLRLRVNVTRAKPCYILVVLLSVGDTASITRSGVTPSRDEVLSIVPVPIGKESVRCSCTCSVLMPLHVACGAMKCTPAAERRAAPATHSTRPPTASAAIHRCHTGTDTRTRDVT